MEKSGQLPAKANLLPWKEPRCVSIRRLGDPRVSIKEKPLHLPCQKSKPGRPVRSLVIILTEFSGIQNKKKLVVRY